MNKKTENKKILVVDDEESITEIIQFELEREGFKVLTAHDGKSAFELIQNQHFDAVITDIHMPNLTGIELAKKISDNRGPANLFCITGGTKFKESELYDAGFKYVFNKPFDTFEICNVLKYTLNENDSQKIQRCSICTISNDIDVVKTIEGALIDPRFHRSFTTLNSIEKFFSMNDFLSPELILVDWSLIKPNPKKTIQSLRSSSSEVIKIAILISSEANLNTIDYMGLEADEYIDMRSEHFKSRLFTILKNRAELDNYKQKESDTQILLAQIVHDISNPLAVIKSKLHALDKNMLPAEKAIKPCLNQVNNIINLTSSAKNFLKSDQTILTLCKDKIPVNKTLQSINGIFENRILEKGITLVINCPDNIFIICDETFFTYSVLANIVSNAIKFSAKGNTIEIALSDEGANLALWIKDQGFGMPLSVRESIIHGDPVHSSRGTQGEKGSGFGLSIAKKYMESIGGGLYIFSTSKQEKSGKSGTAVLLKIPNADRAI